MLPPFPWPQRERPSLRSVDQIVLRRILSAVRRSIRLMKKNPDMTASNLNTLLAEALVLYVIVASIGVLTTDVDLSSFRIQIAGASGALSITNPLKTHFCRT